MALRTHKRQFGYHNSQHRKKIDGEIGQIIMCIVRAEQKQHNGNTEKKFFRWSILIPIVDLLPHVQVVICACVKFKRDTSDPMEHQVGREHVRNIDKSP